MPGVWTAILGKDLVKALDSDSPQHSQTTKNTSQENISDELLASTPRQRPIPDGPNIHYMS